MQNIKIITIDMQVIEFLLIVLNSQAQTVDPSSIETRLTGDDALANLMPNLVLQSTFSDNSKSGWQFFIRLHLV